MTLKEYILHQVGEARREMLAAVEDLSVDDLTSLEPVGHWPVAWIFQHCCQNVDRFLYAGIEGTNSLEQDRRFSGRPDREPGPGDKYPSLEELKERWAGLLDAVIRGLKKMPDDKLQETPAGGKEPLVESFLRVINHTNAHLRAIWCIIGERGIDGKFPEQKTWLA